MALKQAKIPSDILGTPEEQKQVDVAFEPERQRIAERQDARMALVEELSKSQKLQAEEESKQKIAVKEAGVRATGDYISDVEREQRQYREQISANPLPTHKPTQEDLSTYAQLGSLLMTMGLMIGAGGKGNAKAGLDAMTGMLNGWKKGRQDLWQQEARNFEKAFNKVKADRDTIYKNLQEGMKLASTNYAAAKEKFETAAFIAGEGSIVAHRIRTGQLQQALKDMENVDKVWDEFNNKKRAAVSALAQARLQRELADKQRDAMIQAARLKSGGDDLKRQLTEARIKEIKARIDRANKKAEDAGKNEKPPAKEIVAQNTLRNNLIPKLDSAIPVLDRLHQEGTWGKLTTLLAVDPRAAELAFKNDPEALNLILTLAYFRSKEFETAGKALTKKEDQILAPIVRGDLRVYQGIRNAMVDAQKTLTLEQKGLETAYPYIKKVNDAFRKEMSGGSEDRFEVGKTYTDSDGNRAKYLGNGQWEEQ